MGRSRSSAHWLVFLRNRMISGHAFSWLCVVLCCLTLRCSAVAGCGTSAAGFLGDATSVDLETSIWMEPLVPYLCRVSDARYCVEMSFVAFVCVPFACLEVADVVHIWYRLVSGSKGVSSHLLVKGDPCLSSASWRLLPLEIFHRQPAIVPRSDLRSVSSWV